MQSCFAINGYYFLEKLTRTRLDKKDRETELKVVQKRHQSNVVERVKNKPKVLPENKYNPLLLLLNRACLTIQQHDENLNLVFASTKRIEKQEQKTSTYTLLDPWILLLQRKRRKKSRIHLLYKLTMHTTLFRELVGQMEFKISWRKG